MSLQGLGQCCLDINARRGKGKGCAVAVHALSYLGLAAPAEVAAVAFSAAGLGGSAERFDLEHL